jgi:hypothetical protein
VFSLFETVTDLAQGVETLRERRYGVIEARNGRFHRVRLRPFPRIGSVPEIMLLGGAFHRYCPGDCCLLYYNQPRKFPHFLAVKYILSSRRATWASVQRAVEALEEIARIKGSDALLCDAANWRLSTAIMNRMGWESHCPSRWHRHFIGRFYGQYPPRPGWLAELFAARFAARFAAPAREVALPPGNPVATIPPDCSDATPAGRSIGSWLSFGAVPTTPPTSVSE